MYIWKHHSDELSSLKFVSQPLANLFNKQNAQGTKVQKNHHNSDFRNFLVHNDIIFGTCINFNLLTFKLYISANANVPPYVWN